MNSNKAAHVSKLHRNQLQPPQKSLSWQVTEIRSPQQTSNTNNLVYELVSKVQGGSFQGKGPTPHLRIKLVILSQHISERKS